MITFESYQTVPILILRDMDPYMQITEHGQAFPLPGEDFHFFRLDLSLALIKHPNSTFFIQMTGDSMVEEGIMPGDILIVDRSMDPKHKGNAVVYFEGEFVVCKLWIQETGLQLRFFDSEHNIVDIEPDMTFYIWGMIRDILPMNGKVLA